MYQSMVAIKKYDKRRMQSLRPAEPQPPDEAL
jgi:hypothetical protein